MKAITPLLLLGALFGVTISTFATVGPISWWKGEGDATDAAGGNNGVIVGSVAFTNGVSGQAFAINGGYIGIPDSASLDIASSNTATFSVWTYRTNAALPFHVYGKRVGCSGGTGINYQLGIDGTFPTTPINQWLFWTLVYSNGQAVVYTNAVKVSGITWPDFAATNNAPFEIGASGACGGFIGLIDDLRIYDRPLATSEIVSLYASEVPRPSIVTQPVSQGVVAGNTANFSVVASGSPPLSYKWQLNSNNVVSTGSTLSIPNAQQGVAGSYTVIVSNYGGAVTSAAAMLTVTGSVPVVIRQTPSVSFSLGQNCTLSAITIGTDPRANQWQHGGVNIPGATNTSLIFSNLQPSDAGPYSMVASNSLGGTASTNAVLTVLIPPVYHFTTLAGVGGIAGTNDGTGSAVRFALPCGVAVDTNGNVYVADTSNQKIRQVTPAGVVTTIAGTNVGYGSFADGTNSDARFNSPRGIAIDRAGNLYVADTSNYVIRKLTPMGADWVVTTIAGSAFFYGSVDGTNSDARFSNVYGLAVDSATNLYVADNGNHTLRKITPSGTNWIVTTLAGKVGTFGSSDGTNSAAFFADLGAVAVDAAGNIYVADGGNHTVRKVTPGGTVTTLAGKPTVTGTSDGTGNAALFDFPTCLAVDSATNIYVADTFNESVRKMVPSGTNWLVLTVAGLGGIGGTNDGTGSTARFYHPFGMAMDSAGNLYVSDEFSFTIRKGVPVKTAPTIDPTSLAASDGHFGFNLGGTIGQSVVVEASTNLEGWSPLWTNSIGVGSLPFLDLQNGIDPQRYFRAYTP